MIQYQCNTVVAAENDKIVNLLVPSTQDYAARGPVTKVDIVENCSIVCKIDVKWRKVPLKIYLEYENADDKTTKGNRAASMLTKLESSSPSSPALKSKKTLGESAGLRTKQAPNDLIVYATDESKDPNPQNSKQTFIKPEKRMVIKKLDIMEPLSQNKHR